MEQNSQQIIPKAPEIPESEMKMPEDQFGNQPAPESTSKYVINPLFVVALILLLTILAIVIIWGEELVAMFLPETTVELEPLPEAGSFEAVETELNDTENQLNEIDISATEANLNAIEAEMEAELESGSETQI